MSIDTHCHLNFAAFAADWKETADQSVKAGVKKMIVVGADLDTSARAVALAQQHPALWAAVGVHPHHAPQAFDINQLKKLALNPKVVAIGECGLDRHVYQKTKYEETAVTPAVINRQKTIFGQQIQLAKSLKLPLIIHNREAGEDTLDTLNHFCKNDSLYPPGVFHCISGSKKLLQKILALNFYIGVDANIVYSTEVQALVEIAPLNKILLETDAPYLDPNRAGSRNTPQSVKIVARRLAAIKSVAENQVIKQTTANAQKLFKFSR
jgi:TatD DNase family protein